MIISIAGTGKIAEEVMRMLHEEFAGKIEVTGIYAREHSVEHAIDLCQAYAPTGFVYTDYARMLQEAEADFVYIANANHVHHEYAIQAMMADKNGNLLSDLYSIVRVSSTRDLVQSVNLDIKSAALYGGVDYGKSDVLGSKDMPRATAPEETERGFIFADRKRKGFSVDSLPFTLVEVNGIDSLLKSQGCETKLYVKQMATESAFKAMSGDSIRVLHISTHGIANQLSDGNADPMRYCCLLLAGANNTLRTFRGRLQWKKQKLENSISSRRPSAILATCPRAGATF